MAEAVAGPTRQELMAAYKAILRAYIDQRPSGIRLKIARALNTHKSFVSQITNPSDPTPLPAKHLDVIFEVCRLSARERETFLAAYTAAHPQTRTAAKRNAARGRIKTLQLEIPVLDDANRQQELEDLIRNFVRQLARLLGP
jgi:hypothetical protein